MRQLLDSPDFAAVNAAHTKYTALAGEEPGVAASLQALHHHRTALVGAKRTELEHAAASTDPGEITAVLTSSEPYGKELVRPRLPLSRPACINATTRHGLDFRRILVYI